MPDMDAAAQTGDNPKHTCCVLQGNPLHGTDVPVGKKNINNIDDSNMPVLQELLWMVTNTRHFVLLTHTLPDQILNLVFEWILLGEAYSSAYKSLKTVAIRQ